MSSWLLVFLILWTPLLCLMSVVLGAFLMHCKANRIDPISRMVSHVTGRTEAPSAKGDPETTFWNQ